MSQSADEGLLVLDAEKFKLALVEKRAGRREQVLNDSQDLCDQLPLRVNVRVGDAIYKQPTFDLIVDTGNRFLHSMREADSKKRPRGSKPDGDIVLDPSDVPEAACVFKILALQPPKQLSTSQLVGVIKSLSYMNATDALDAMACYLPEPLDSSTVTALLAALVQHSVTSSLLQHLCQALDTAFSDLQPGAVSGFWEAMALVANVGVCKKLEEHCGLIGQWLWRSLAAVICRGDCAALPSAVEAGDRVLLPTEKFPSLHDHLSNVLHMCASQMLCGCRSRMVMAFSAQGRLDRVGEVMIVSHTAQSLAIVAKMPKCVERRSEEVNVLVSGTPHKFAILCKPHRKDGGIVQGEMSAYLFYAGLSPGTTYKATFSLFDIQDTWALLSGRKAACKAFAQASSTDLPHDLEDAFKTGWGFHDLTVRQDHCNYVLVFVELELNATSHT